MVDLFYVPLCGHEEDGPLLSSALGYHLLPTYDYYYKESYNGRRSIETILLQPPVTILSIANNYLTPNRWASSKGVPIIYHNNNDKRYLNVNTLLLLRMILFRIDLIYYWAIVRDTSKSIDGIGICSVINEELDHLSK